MDFDAKKPSHVFALVILVVAFAMVILSPIYSFFNAPLSIDSTQIEVASGLFRMIVEIIALLIQILLVAIGIFIIVPFIWYFLVNKLSFKEIKKKRNKNVKTKRHLIY